jgi:hypothetical protein
MSGRGGGAAGADLPHLISKIHAPAAGRVRLSGHHSFSSCSNSCIFGNSLFFIHYVFLSKPRDMDLEKQILKIKYLLSFAEEIVRQISLSFEHLNNLCSISYIL